MTLATGVPPAWISANRQWLRLIEYIGSGWTHTSSSRSWISQLLPPISRISMTFVVTVRDLGPAATLDQEFTFAPQSSHDHIHYQFRDCFTPPVPAPRTISRSLTSTAIATLVHAFITARLYYCSTLYVGLL